jgi:hypothetical protein
LIKIILITAAAALNTHGFPSFGFETRSNSFYSVTIYGEEDRFAVVPGSHFARLSALFGEIINKCRGWGEKYENQ